MYQLLFSSGGGRHEDSNPGRSSTPGEGLAEVGARLYLLHAVQRARLVLAVVPDLYTHVLTAVSLIGKSWTGA